MRSVLTPRSYDWAGPPMFTWISSFVFAEVARATCDFPTRRSPTVEDQPMSSAARSIITLGLDVHKESITVAVLPAGMSVPTRFDRLPNDLGKVRRYCERLATQGE